MTRIVWAPQAIDDVEGRVVPEAGNEALREIIRGNYRIVYRVKQDAVEVVTVFHAARLFRLG